MVRLDSQLLELSAIYRALPRSGISYSCFRARVKQLEVSSRLTLNLLLLAKKLPTRSWRLVCGSGRSKQFTYQGDLIPRFHGQPFISIAHFLYVTGNLVKRALVYSRLKAGWLLDDALSYKKNISPAVDATVYRLTHKASGKAYIGVTTVGVGKRWQQHVSNACRAPQRLFYKYINQFGEAAFELDVLEALIPLTKCSIREKFWIETLNTLTPNGLNSNSGGQIPAGRHSKYTLKNITYSTIRAAALAHSDTTNGECSEFVAARHISAGKTPPERSRKHSKSIHAGTPLYRIWLGLKRRDRLGEGWQNYEVFKFSLTGQVRSDAHPHPGFCLVTKLGKGKLNSSNYLWATKAQVAARIHAKPVKVYGKVYTSLTAVAKEYKVATSTLRYRIQVRNMTAEEALAHRNLKKTVTNKEA